MLTKNDVIQGAGQLAKNDITWGQANSTVEPPDHKSKQSRVTSLSLNKHWSVLSLCVNYDLYVLWLTALFAQSAFYLCINVYGLDFLPL
jgi:hypothetical protein